MSEQQPSEGEDFIAARHSIKPKGEDLPSEEFKGISESGVELAREQSQEWLGVLENAPEGSVMILSPTSEQIRTKSSMRAMTQEMKSVTSQDEESNISVITEEDFADPKLTYEEMIGIITSKIETAPDKKFVVSAPLFIKGFALGVGRWMDQDGNLTPYAADLLARNEKDDQACLQDWVVNEGRSGDLEGPNPTQVAEEHLEGIRKLGNFAKRYMPDRPLIVGSVGHSWNLDALAIYLANNGKVDAEGLEKVGGTMIKEMEPIILTSDENGSKLKYGDRLEISLEEKSPNEGENEKVLSRKEILEIVDLLFEDNSVYGSEEKKKILSAIDNKESHIIAFKLQVDQVHAEELQKKTDELEQQGQHKMMVEISRGIIEGLKGKINLYREILKYFGE